MGNEWPRRQISKICELIVDCVNKTAPKVDHETPFKMIRTTNVRHGRIDLTDCKYVTEETYESWTRRATVLRGDVLLTREAPIGEVGRVEVDDTIFLGQRLIQYRANNEVLDSRFLLYSFLSHDLQHQFRMHEGSGSVVSHIKVPDCSKFEVPLPPLPEQKAIAHVLGALDARIELNRRMNETLEGMAQALFKSWFVDFDPVLDNALASGKEIPEELQERAKARQALGDQRRPLPPEIRTLFPDQFTYNDDLGWIPEGWKVVPLNKVAENPRRGVKAEEIQPGTAYIGLQDMPQKSISLPSWGVSDDVASSKFLFHRGEILFGKLRPYFHKVGIAPVDGVCSTDILIVLPKKDAWFSLVFGHVTSKVFIEYVTAASTGTKMPRTNWKDMGRFMVTLPNEHVANFLTKQFQEYLAKILLNIEQNQNLGHLRDTLLPKLLSGELRIPDAEKLVAEVA